MIYKVKHFYLHSNSTYIKLIKEEINELHKAFLEYPLMQKRNSTKILTLSKTKIKISKIEIFKSVISLNNL